MLGLQLGSSLTSLGALSAFADKKEKIVNEEAVALSNDVGWLLLLAAGAVVALFILQSELFKRWWLEREDPRAIGVYRIIFAFFVISNMNDVWEYFTFLFTDEGLWTADVARWVHARHQFRGFGDGFVEAEAWGFFDFQAFLEFLKGPKYSLLYFWDSPTFFWCHLWAFEICAALFLIGFRTRLMGVLTFFLMNSIFFRNHLFWEGTELVYRVFLVYLICAKSGHAYSVDNWLRCRKLRKKGLLSEPGGPGGGAGLAPDDDHPKGLQAIYRLIPAWPRRLALVQFGALYADTGILKNGSVWAKGEAIYYAWNMDHFYRFYPQQITALTGTNVLKAVTIGVHWGESFFAVVLISVFYFWIKKNGFAPSTGWRRIGIRLALLTLLGCAAALIFHTWPVHYGPKMWEWFAGPKTDPGAEKSRYLFTAAFVVILLGMWFAFQFLGRRPIVIRKLPRKGELKTPIYIDKDWVMKWIFGRRIWLPWHIATMGGIFILMNIGMFQPAMLTQTLLFFTGVEVALFGAFLVHWAPRTIPKSGGLKGLLFFWVWLPMLILKVAPKRLKEGGAIIPPEDPTLPHHKRDAARFPQWAMVATALILLAGILVKVQYDVEWWTRIWMAAVLFAAGVAFQQRRAAGGEDIPVKQTFPNLAPYRTPPQDDEGERTDGRVRAPWAYGPSGRFLLIGVILWHITAVAVWLSPDKACMSTWRGEARQTFRKWLTVTQTDQGWGMFAPNPPRSNVFLKVLVYNDKGEAFDMRTDVYAPEMKPIPWIWNDRIRKMNRRIIGGESGPTQWYRKWYARWHCRQWQRDPPDGSPPGTIPERVELVKVWYKIPSPQDTAERGYYSPEKLYEKTKQEKIEHTERCRTTVMGQLPNWVRERHGLPPLPEDVEYKVWHKHKRQAWDKFLEEKANPELAEQRKREKEAKKEKHEAERREREEKRDAARAKAKAKAKRD